MAVEALEQRVREVHDQLVAVDADSWLAYGAAVLRGAQAQRRRELFDLALCALSRLSEFEIEHSIRRVDRRGVDGPAVGSASR